MTSTQTWEDILSVEAVEEMADFADPTSTALQSQYAHGQRFKGAGSVFQSQIDATQDLANLSSMVADMQTAKGVYLDWWGQRVGVDRLLKVVGEYYRFDDDYFRFLLFYRARCNLADATASTMNQMLSQLTDTRVFVVDYQTMEIQSIVVIGAISDLQAQILETYGLLNRPAGVLTNFLIIYPDEKIFGFLGSDLLPFDQGVFNPGRTIGMQ
jgi:hypothetical protein